VALSDRVQTSRQIGIARKLIAEAERKRSWIGALRDDFNAHCKFNLVKSATVGGKLPSSSLVATSVRFHQSPISNLANRDHTSAWGMQPILRPADGHHQSEFTINRNIARSIEVARNDLGRAGPNPRRQVCNCGKLPSSSFHAAPVRFSPIAAMSWRH